ncbi:hypothetical protein [Moheibacter stercoris]|uniref:Lipoprotein n=1 Tax=Moheibacter stercoris TaxID=1628251 RepID=A0ABV2LQE2_9FLAO
MLLACQKPSYFDENKSHLKYHSVDFTVTKIDTISWGFLIEGFTGELDSVLIVSPNLNKEKNCKKHVQVGDIYPLKLQFESYYGEIDGFSFDGVEYSTNYAVSYNNKNLDGLCFR